MKTWISAIVDGWSLSPRTQPIRILFLVLVLAGIGTLHADGGEIYRCASSEDVYRALKNVKPGDTVLLEGGKRYEIDKSFKLDAHGEDGKRIKFTSEDASGQGRYAVISTVGGKKEEDLTAIRLLGSYWYISRIEISGKKVPLEEWYWDTNGFQLGLYLLGPDSHHNVVEDVHIHHTHNAAVAVRDDSHHNTFRRMNIHHIGEWLNEGYNAHEGEGFYLGSSKSFREEGNKARIHDVLIEDSVLGPGLLGQFIDIKYGASFVTARNNVLYCNEKSYNEEVVKLAGYANLIENNRFVGSNERLTRYIHVHNKRTKDPVRVNYLGQENIPSPTGRDNTIVNNIFYTDDPSLLPVDIDVKDEDRSSLRVEQNRVEPLANRTDS